MPSLETLLVQAPDRGLNALLPDNMTDPRQAGEGSKNVIYERGFIRRDDGFAKVDLTTTGLNSGEQVLAVFKFTEIDGTAHLIACTESKIYKHNKAINAGVLYRKYLNNKNKDITRFL